ncbi:MAG TPA: ABC transporter substrate-binding protein [Solirubrobacter sp.]|nr:ABC transporter substrate-binding protein [Solirubrobacter sp.]
MDAFRLAGVAATVALALGVAACGSDDSGGSSGKASSSKGGDPIKVGYVVSKTGPAAADANSDVVGAQLAAKEINDAGGVDGHKIEITVRDDKTDPTTATREARDLALSGNVNILAGATVTAIGAAIKEVANATKVPYLISTANGASLTEVDPSPYVFRAWSNSRVMPGPVADYASKQPWKKYVLVTGNNDFGKSISDNFKSYVQAKNPNAQFVKQILVEQGATDYSAAINQLRSIKPDAVFLGGVFGASFIAFAKAAVPAGIYDDAHVMGFMGNADLDAVGSLVPAGKQIGYNAYYNTYDDPFTKEFDEKIKAVTGKPSDGSNFVGYMTVKWIAEAVKRGGGTSREQILKGLSGASMDTLIGDVTIRPGDHEATGSYFYGIVDKGADGKPAFTQVGTAPGTDFLPPDKG